MKENPGKEAIQRLQALIARETGASLRPSVDAELSAIVRHACGGARENIVEATHDEKPSFVQREVTILLADLRGFTAITATLPAGAVITMLNRCLGRMNEIISRHHGFIDKFMGDSIMVLFGVPFKQEDDVKRALACAIEMQLAMEEINHQDRQEGIPELSMGIGINTGNVTAGKIGSDFYSVFTVIGDEVNLTSRIEAFSLRGQILIGENTYDRCRDFITVSEAMEVFVKGKTLPVKLRELYAIPSWSLKAPRKESRHSQRLQVRLPCTFRLIQNKVVMPKVYRATIRDIGYFGLLLETDHSFTAYDDIKIEFDLPLVEYRASDIYAKVVELEHDQSGHLAGIEFTSITPEANMKIQLYVQLLVMAAE